MALPEAGLKITISSPSFTVVVRAYSSPRGSVASVGSVGAVVGSVGAAVGVVGAVVGSVGAVVGSVGVVGAVPAAMPDGVVIVGIGQLNIR